MTIQEMTERAVKVRELYDQLNLKNHGIKWNEERLMAGFVGDVGDLSKIIMGKAGVRVIDDVDAKLVHELSDCLWSLLVLADRYGIEMEEAFTRSMDALEVRANKAIASGVPIN
ncbi:MAG TPA: MazG nucleotide pyrophosphohydrolase domain-containing protein [Candidatus Saccharimonadales bacterium]|nr:MazG nucleotide pyrophosphohydrolase domain-containing protein [Candidatus Saccharimonadales bacterium]